MSLTEEERRYARGLQGSLIRHVWWSATYW